MSRESKVEDKIDAGKARKGRQGGTVLSSCSWSPALESSLKSASDPAGATRREEPSSAISRYKKSPRETSQHVEAEPSRRGYPQLKMSIKSQRSVEHVELSGEVQRWRSKAATARPPTGLRLWALALAPCAFRLTERKAFL